MSLGRPREFDLDQAVAIATDLFYRRGYDGASISDLTGAMGISAPSFYFAFKSKDALFQRIVEAYLARQNRMVDEAFERTDARALVEALLVGFAELLTLPGQAPGCLLLNNALPIEDGRRFRADWAGGREALRSRLEARLRTAPSSERSMARRDPAALARLVLSMVWGFAVDAHSGATRAELQQAINQFLRLWDDTSVGET